MKRGEVYWADLVPRSGSEQTGRRPVILVSHEFSREQLQRARSKDIQAVTVAAAAVRVGDFNNSRAEQITRHSPAIGWILIGSFSAPMCISPLEGSRSL